MSDIFDKSFKENEIEKLKSVLKSCQVTLQHIDDLKEQMKELVCEIADELEIKPSEINKAARSLYKNDIAEKRAQHEAVEELLGIAGYDVSGDTDV